MKTTRDFHHEAASGLHVMIILWPLEKIGRH
jgi:hypothetical protein